MDRLIKTELGIIQEVTVEKMRVLYLEVPNSVSKVKEAWPKFEESFHSLKGRKMFGLDYDNEKVYRVCSKVLEEDEGETFGLNEFTFEGGKYRRLRLKENPPQLYEKIGPAFELLIKEYSNEIDWERPLIEYYKSENILDVMVPTIK